MDTRTRPVTRKLVKGVIRRKIQDWLKHIDDEVLRKDVAANVVVTGGCIASMLMRTPVNDYDVYLQDKDVLIRLMQYYLGKFADNPPPRMKYDMGYGMSVNVKRSYPRCIIQSAGIMGREEDAPDKDTVVFNTVPVARPTTLEPDLGASFAEGLKTNIMDVGADSLPVDNRDVAELIQEAVADEFAGKTTGPGAAEANKYRPIFITTNAITLSNDIQIVTRFFGTPEEIHKNFDFVHCTNYYTYGDNNLVLKPEALESITFMELQYIGSLYPLCSLIRLRKFAKRGWNYGADAVIAAAVQCHDLDLYDIRVLEEQLIGVDTGYFNHVIEILKAGQAAGKALNGTYLVEVLNEVFR